MAGRGGGGRVRVRVKVRVRGEGEGGIMLSIIILPSSSHSDDIHGGCFSHLQKIFSKANLACFER